MRYDAFLSYSHALDGRLAPALQRGLQRFARRWQDARALTIFRDETNLSTSPHLWKAIEAALEASRFFVLLASPAAARSPWVEREVSWWVAHKPADTLLIVVTEGELSWDGETSCLRSDVLPPSLATTLEAEPRFLNLRWARTVDTDLSLQHNAFREAIADLAATLHGRPKHELIGEEVRQHRRQRRLARAAVAALAMLTLTASGIALWAIQQQHEAERQAIVAESNFATALDAADAMVTEVADTLTDLTGVSKERVAGILTNAEALFARLAETGGERRILLDRQAGMLLAFARAYMELGNSKASLERATAAIEKLDRAAALPGEPSANTLTARRASGLFLLGIAQQTLIDSSTALSTFEEARRLYAAAVAADPTNAGWLAEYAEAHYYVATSLFQLGDLAKAMEVAEAGMALMRQALALEPDNPRWLRDLAVGNNALAVGLQFQGRDLEASAVLLEARDALVRLVASDPSNLDLKQALATNHQQLAQLAGRQGDTEVAVAELRASSLVLADLAARDPSNIIVAQSYGTVMNDLGNALSLIGDEPEALSAYTEALEFFERALNINPDSVPLTQGAIVASTALASISSDANPDAVLAVYERAAETLRRLIERDQENRVLQVHLAQLLAGGATASASLGRASAAIADSDEALALLQQVTLGDPTNYDFQTSYVLTCLTAGWSMYLLDDASRAIAYYQRGLRLAESYAAHAPNNAAWVPLVDDASNSLIFVLTGVGKLSEAAEVQRRLLEFLIDRNSEASPDPRSLQLESDLRLSLGWQSADVGELQSALREFELARDLAQQANELDNGDPRIWEALGSAHGAIALTIDDARLAEIANAYIAAIDAYQHVLELEPNNDSIALSLASNLNLLAWAHFNVGDLKTAENEFLDAVDRHVALSARSPGDANLAMWVGHDHRGLARLLRTKDDIRGALSANDKAIAAYGRAVELDKDDPFLAQQLAREHSNAATLHELAEDLSAASRSYEASVLVYQEMLDAAPEDAGIRLEFGYVLERQALNGEERGLLEIVERTLTRAFDLISASTNPFAEDPDFIQLHAYLLADEGRLLLNRGKRVRALASFQNAIAQAERFLSHTPDDDDFRYFLVQTKRWLIEVKILSGALDNVDEILDAALAEGLALEGRGLDVTSEIAALKKAREILSERPAQP